MKKSEITYLLSLLLMLSSLTVVAQPKSAADLAGKLESYYTGRGEEKVYMHMASQYAQAGDKLPFKAYILDAFTNQPNNLSKVLRVELWDETLSQRYHAQRIKIQSGTAMGSVQIPSSLSNGKYIVRAFTQWMTNYDQTADIPLIVDKSGSFQVQTEPWKTLTFYPEGGSLVAGVANKIVVRSDGPVAGTVLNRKGKEVASFETSDLGLGAFVLVPNRDELYTIETGNEKQNYSFPLVQESGLSFLLQQTKSGYRVNLQASKQLSRDLEAGDISVIVESRGIAYFTISGDIKDKGYFITELEAATLPYGPARIMIFDYMGELLAQRSFFNDHDLNNPVHIGLAKTSYGRREKVDLSIFNDIDEPVSASVSVTKKDHFVNGTSSILEFSSSNSFSTEVIDPGHPHLDLLMIAETWQGGNWYAPDADRRAEVKYRPEQLLAYDGIALGKEGEPLASAQLDVWLINNDLVYQSKTNANGEFSLVLFDFGGQDDFIFDSPEGDLAEIKIYQLSEQLKETKVPEVAATSERDYSYKRRINQVYDFYHSEESQGGQVPAIDLIPKADYTVDLNQYIEFTSMKEMFVEVVTGVLVGSDNSLRVYIDKDGRYADDPPLFFINGQPNYDDQLVLELDPLEIDQISVLNTEETLLKYKSVGKNGIVDIRLKENVAVAQPKTFVKNMNGLSQYQAPYYPDYGGAQLHSRLPDLREQLYWKGDAELSASGQLDLSYYTSDIVGEYVMIIEGITASGRAFRLTEEIEVGTMLE